MLFGPRSRRGEKSSCRLSFLSIFSHKFFFFFMWSKYLMPMQMLYKWHALHKNLLHLV